jgi:peroxiredoxin
MKKYIVLIALLFVAFGCTNSPKTFEYTITGSVIGKESGEICFMETGKTGDDVIIKYENGKFEYNGTSPNMYCTGIIFTDDEEGNLYPIVIEPGEIIIELNADSAFAKSKTLAGENNIAVSNAYHTYVSYALSGMDMESLPDSVYKLINKNRNNYAGIFFLNTMGRAWQLFNQNELETFLMNVKKPLHLKSRDYKELYSYWLSRKDSVNDVGNKAINFSLPDIDGNMISFHDASKGKVTLIELSASWCGNTTENSKSFIPVYNEFKDKGFEIITIVCESNYERWEQWIEKEKYPWLTLIELEFDSENEILYSEFLFSGFNYLVDNEGTVIAKDIEAYELAELLSKKLGN